MKLEKSLGQDQTRVPTVDVKLDDRTSGGRVHASIGDRPWLKEGDRVLCIDESEETWAWGTIMRIGAEGRATIYLA